MVAPFWRRREEEKMKNFVSRRLWLLILVLAAVSAGPSRDAVATLASSYYEGSAIYDTDEGLTGIIEFAVYDTENENELWRDEYLDNGLEKPGQGRYIYAYQVFSNPFVEQGDVAHFAILGAGGGALDESVINGTEAQDDGQAGIAPSPLVSETQGVWKWTSEGGLIAQGEHSWFLVFSSDMVETTGDFEIAGPELPAPAPEPGTLLLLGLGGITVSSRRRRTCGQ
jgi:hypothetical protein